MTTTSTRGMVAGFLEGISSDVFDRYHDEITALIGKHHGVYALYRRGRLYYVGLAIDLRGRVKNHLKDRHARRWDSFSLYLITNLQQLRELETLVVHMAAPKGNIQSGKFVSSRNLRRDLGQLMKQRDKVEHKKILGGGSKKSIRKKPQPRKKRAPSKRKPSLVGLLPANTTLAGDYKKVRYTATVDAEGRITLDGKVFNSPSSAGSAAKGGKATDGWIFWKYQSPDGRWILIDELRKGKPKPTGSRTL